MRKSSPRPGRFACRPLMRTLPRQASPTHRRRRRAERAHMYTCMHRSAGRPVGSARRIAHGSTSAHNIHVRTVVRSAGAPPLGVCVRNAEAHLGQGSPPPGRGKGRRHACMHTSPRESDDSVATRHRMKARWVAWTKRGGRAHSRTASWPPREDPYPPLFAGSATCPPLGLPASMPLSEPPALRGGRGA